MRILNQPPEFELYESPNNDFFFVWIPTKPFTRVLAAPMVLIGVAFSAVSLPVMVISLLVSLFTNSLQAQSTIIKAGIYQVLRIPGVAAIPLLNMQGSYGTLMYMYRLDVNGILHRGGLYYCPLHVSIFVSHKWDPTLIPEREKNIEQIEDNIIRYLKDKGLVDKDVPFWVDCLCVDQSKSDRNDFVSEFMARVSLFKDFLQCDIAIDRYYKSYWCLAEYVLWGENHVLGEYFTMTKSSDLLVIKRFLWNSVNLYDALVSNRGNLYNKACYIDWLITRSERFFKFGMNEEDKTRVAAAERIRNTPAATRVATSPTNQV